MPSSDFLKLAICGACGLAFGIAAEKARVHEPYIIRGQMDFSYLTMVKMFLGAAASSLVSMALLTMSSDSNRMKFHDARANFAVCMKNKGMISAVVGGTVLGAGMTLSGACPGMVYVQVGTQLHHALYTLAGGFLGALLYALLEPAVVQLTKPRGIVNHYRLDNDCSYATAAVPLAAVLGCAIAGLEVYRPWTADVSSSWGGNFWTMKTWPPFVGGALIGLLQIPVILSVRDTLGASSSYCTLLSQALVSSRLRNAFPYLARYQNGISNWWQVFFAGGIIIGGFLSAQASGNLGLSSSVTQSQALVGGAMMVFGAQLAGGCTSGHGLSGMALLFYSSFVTVAAMFAGAMGTYAAMKQGVI